MTTMAGLDHVMRVAWQARSEVLVDGWIARLSGGVTQRANSVLPAAAPVDLSGAILRIEKLYADHGLTPTFQLSPAAQPGGLDKELADRGYQLFSPTIVQIASIENVLRQIE